MLVAKQQNGKLFILRSDDDPQVLKTLRQQQTFYCPQCLGSVMLKVGRIKIPHFAHHKNSACEQSFSEGETLTHLLGKQQLFNHFQSLSLQVQLEQTIPQLSQRPDLLIHHNYEQYALEFQHSALPCELFNARTAGYLSQNIKPLWILSTPKSVTLPGVQKVSLTDFFKLFLYTYKEQPLLTSYCPKRQSFFYFSHFLHVHKNTYICVIDGLQLHQQQFPFLIPKQVSFERFCEMYTLHKQYTLSYLQSTVKYSKQGTQNLFLRYLYELRLSVVELPPYLRAPIPGNEVMGVLTSGWQCALHYFAQQLEKPVWQLKKLEVQLFLQCAKLPYTSQSIQVIRHYVKLCKELNITSHRVCIDEERWIDTLYRHFIANLQ